MAKNEKRFLGGSLFGGIVSALLSFVILAVAYVALFGGNADEESILHSSKFINFAAVDAMVTTNLASYFYIILVVAGLSVIASIAGIVVKKDILGVVRIGLVLIALIVSIAAIGAFNGVVEEGGFMLEVAGDNLAKITLGGVFGQLFGMIGVGMFFAGNMTSTLPAVPYVTVAAASILCFVATALDIAPFGEKKKKA